MINKQSLKYYLIPAGIFIVIILIILLVPMGNKKIDSNTTTPIPLITPFPSSGQSPSRSQAPNLSATPTLIPPHFTGVDASQTFPPEMIRLSEQKTTLRRQAPLEMSFGTISFDYENDMFVLTLKEPKDQSQIAFNDWLKQTYPAIPIDQFSAIN